MNGLAGSCEICFTIIISAIQYIYLILLALYYAQEAVKLSTDNKQRGVCGVQRTGELIYGCGAGDDPTKLIKVIRLLRNEHELDIQETSLT